MVENLGNKVQKERFLTVHVARFFARSIPIEASKWKVPNGCIGSNGYINNNNCLMNGVELSGVVGGGIGGCNMSSYTNGQHVVGPFKTYSNPDTLICGNCRELFTDLTELLDHKRSYCKLRFTCKCLSTSPVQKVYPTPQAKLVCVACKDSFSNPWDLMVHAQAAHMVNIYELGESPSGEEGKTTAMGGDRTTNSTPTMPCSPPALEHGKLNGTGAVNNPMGNGIHELDDDKNDHAEVSELELVYLSIAHRVV
uniref:C2H2-type domain-containing protein n=1 Tax=Anopheles culicifacies TaxID=139723 RepID=A0A182MWD3_9DIPT